MRSGWLEDDDRDRVTWQASGDHAADHAGGLAAGLSPAGAVAGERCYQGLGAVFICRAAPALVGSAWVYTVTYRALWQLAGESDARGFWGVGTVQGAGPRPPGAAASQ